MSYIDTTTGEVLSAHQLRMRRARVQSLLMRSDRLLGYEPYQHYHRQPYGRTRRHKRKERWQIHALVLMLMLLATYVVLGTAY